VPALDRLAVALNPLGRGGLVWYLLTPMVAARAPRRLLSADSSTAGSMLLARITCRERLNLLAWPISASR
jgi:hypothetical protein